MMTGYTNCYKQCEVGAVIHPRPISERMGMMVVVIMVFRSIKTDTPMSLIKRCLLVFDNPVSPYPLELI